MEKWLAFPEYVFHKMLFIIYSVFYNIHLNKNKELPIFWSS